LIPLLEQHLTQLHLASIRTRYHTQAQTAAQAGWSYEAYLAELFAEEIEQRTRNRLQRRIKEARFPLHKELADFDFAAAPHLNRQIVMALAQGAYIPTAESVLLVGNPGLGKSHIAIGLGLAACRQDLRVRFYNVTHLVNELQAAQADHQLPAYLEKALHHQLIILDEFGYVPFSPMGAQLLFQFCAALHERTALMLTTNLPFGDWGQVLGDERLAGGLLDRLTYQAHILEFVGESYRFRQGLARHQPVQEKLDVPAPVDVESVTDSLRRKNM
jgi:DNA replication protein DnaC